MGVIRRVTALTTGLLVLQLTLTGAAAPCIDSVPGAERGEAGHSGMPVSHEATGGTHAGHAVAVDAASHDMENCDASPAQQDSSRPTDDGPCLAMTSCVSPMVNLATQPSFSDAPIIVDAWAGVALEPPTRSTAPELPPPRA